MSEKTKQQELLDQVFQPFTCSAFWAETEQSKTWLYSTFTINLPEPILVEGEPGEPISIGVNLENLDAEVLLNLNPALGRIKKQNEERWYYAVTQLEVTVSGSEVLPSDVKDQQDYFNAQLAPKYQEAAVQACNRLSTFLNYRLWSSLFSAMERFSADFGGDPETANAMDDLSQKPRFALHSMSEQEQANIQAYIGEQYSLELAEAFLAEAQQSILGKRSRRACLELSMACEAAVKKRIQSADVLQDVIHGSFKSQHQAAYIGINGLFHARDELNRCEGGFFTITSSAKRETIQEDLKEWGASVTCLSHWMAAQAG